MRFGQSPRVDRAALDEHFATPHFATVAATLAELLAEPFTLDELRP